MSREKSLERRIRLIDYAHGQTGGRAKHLERWLIGFDGVSGQVLRPYKTMGWRFDQNYSQAKVMGMT